MDLIRLTPVIHKLDAERETTAIVLYNKQPRIYDETFQEFLDYMELRSPDIVVDVQADSDIDSLSRIMIAISRIIEEDVPQVVLTTGCSEISLAAAITAAKMGVPAGQIIASEHERFGVTSQSVNNVLTTICSEYHFADSEKRLPFLHQMGIDSRSIFITGDPLVESIFAALRKRRGKKDESIDSLKLKHDYILVDFKTSGEEKITDMVEVILDTVGKMNDLDVVFLVTPGLKKRADAMHLIKTGTSPNIHYIESTKYPEYLFLLEKSIALITDSEVSRTMAETLKVPSLVLPYFWIGSVRMKEELPLDIQIRLHLQKEIDQFLDSVKHGAHQFETVEQDASSKICEIMTRKYYDAELRPKYAKFLIGKTIYSLVEIGQGSTGPDTQMT